MLHGKFSLIFISGAWGGPERPPPPPPGPLKLQICRPLRAKRQLQRPILMETKGGVPYYLEDHPRTWKWLISMASIVSPLRMGFLGPLPNGRTP